MGFANQSLPVVWFITDLFPKWCGVGPGAEAFLGQSDPGWVERGSELRAYHVGDVLYTWSLILTMTFIMLYRWGSWGPEELNESPLAHSWYGGEPVALSSSPDSRLEPRKSRSDTKCLDWKVASPTPLISDRPGIQTGSASLSNSKLPANPHQFQLPLCHNWASNLPEVTWRIRGCTTHTSSMPETTPPVLPRHCPGKGLPENGLKDDFWSLAGPGFLWSRMSHFGEAGGPSSEALFLCLVWSASRGKMMKWRMALDSFCHLHANLSSCFPFARGSPELGWNPWAQHWREGELICNSSCRKGIVKGTGWLPQKARLKSPSGLYQGSHSPGKILRKPK